MTTDQALLPRLISKSQNQNLSNVLSVFAGVILISLLAQVSIPLPFTPVPITGQTFGVALTSLLWGRKRGFATMLSYLTLGSLGFPLFALGKSGFVVGPTMGYLVGMLFASFLMGTLADLGWTKSFFKTWLAAFLGSTVTFSFGLWILSYFIPGDQLLIAGLLPFLPGDLIKTALASTLAYKANHLVSPK